MTKRKDKKAPIKISAAQKEEVSAKDVEELERPDEQTLEQTLEPQQVEEVVEVETEVEEEVQPAQPEVEQEQPEQAQAKSAKKTEKQEINKKGGKNSKKTAKKDKKEKKGIKRRAKETVSELKKVVWPKFPEVVKRTGVVLAFVLIFAVVILALDLLLGLATRPLINRTFDLFG